jgi:amino acid transporter
MGNERKGLGGLLTVLIISLALHTFFYFKFSHDLTVEFKSPIAFIPFNIAIIGTWALIYIGLKKRLGITVTKVFFITNALFWSLSTYLIPIVFPLLVIAALYGFFGWVYLDSSSRVESTLIH